MRQPTQDTIAPTKVVSIHAPRAGCDLTRHGGSPRRTVSIHAPRAGCDDDVSGGDARDGLFQFTHPVRGATETAPPRRDQKVSFNSRTPCGVRRRISSASARNLSFNSRTPCGVRRCWAVFATAKVAVSIHAPRAGCDDQQQQTMTQQEKFQFTHPVRGATSTRRLR